jgi:hypothetical protein
MAAQDYERLHCRDAWRIQLDFQQGFCSIRKEFGEGFGKGNECGVIAGFESASNCAPAVLVSVLWTVRKV